MKQRRLGSELGVAARLTLALLFLGGIVYPAMTWGISQVAFPWRAGGSLVYAADGRLIGSELIGQKFSRPEYFHGRPSAAGYDAASSSGSNIGPTNPQLLTGNGNSYAGVIAYAAGYRSENGLPATAEVPSDAATASGSGLDPHISPANAEGQLARVAATRGALLSESVVRTVVRAHTEGPTLGILGEARVNVLPLNLALDSASAAARGKP
jgi:K+-transporting ATPase ATPase C chain